MSETWCRCQGPISTWPALCPASGITAHFLQPHHQETYEPSGVFTPVYAQEGKMNRWSRTEIVVVAAAFLLTTVGVFLIVEAYRRFASVTGWP